MIFSLMFFGIQSSGHNYIGSEHLLLGLLREGEGVAARVLEGLGADPNNIRTQAVLFTYIYFLC
jgi:ATP-dependent Clp protease ATP-binding subunit ClpA